MRPSIKQVTILAAIGIPILTGCGAYGEAHNYNAAPPASNIAPTWTRIESPYHYHTIIRACVSGDGIYIDLADNNSVTVVPADPVCRSRG